MPALPTTNMTANWDASVMAGNVFAGIVAGAASGTVASGGQVGAWQSTVNNDHVWRPNTNVSVFNPPDLRWENDTILTNPSIKIIAGTFEPVLASNTAVVLTSDTFHSASAKTLIFSFLLESGSLLENNALVYLNSVLLGSPKNNYFGTFLRNDAGTIRLYAYNWDTNADSVSAVVLEDTKYVVVVTHDGVNLSMTLMTVSGDTSSSVASGNTDTLSAYRLADSNAAGTEQVAIRIGQITMWDAALTGADLSNAKDYYYNKWFLGALTGAFIRAAAVFGANGTVESSHTALLNLDQVTRTANMEGALFLGGYFVLYEQALAPSPVANAAVIYAKDTGGKTELLVLFPTGVAQQIKIEA